MEQDVMAKLKKFVEKHGWLIIIALIIAFIISLLVLIRERSKRRETK